MPKTWKPQKPGEPDRIQCSTTMINIGSMDFLNMTHFNMFEDERKMAELLRPTSDDDLIMAGDIPFKK